MMRKILYMVVAAMLVGFAVHAQTVAHLPTSLPLRVQPAVKQVSIADGLQTSVLNRKNLPQTVPPDFYAQHLSFFCRQEQKMQQVHVPLAFRVGSIDDCNRLEQKPGYR